jgi:hypothetical protein
MKYWVFTAANIPKNELAIKMAVYTVSILDNYWDMNACTTGIYEGSKFTINHNDGNNTSICAEDDDIHRLIYSCMAFARENEKLKLKEKQ